MLAGLITTMLALLLLPAVAPAKKAVSNGSLYGIYNTRYCEIFTVNPSESGTFLVDIFNTVGLNDCPKDKWKAVDFNEVRESQGAALAAPNGPRRWVIDAITGASADAPIVLSGLEVRKVGVLETSSLAPEPFTVLTINRTTEWNYRKGRSLRLVISPNGTRFAMQAYTRGVDASITEKRLNRIDRRPAMALPEGWRFKTKRLKRKLVLSSVGSTRIVRDGLGCVYQRFRWPNKR